MNVEAFLDLQRTVSADARGDSGGGLDEVRLIQQALVLGPHVEKFEKNLAEYCGTKHAIGVSSGSDALLCLRWMALQIKPGDEVICPTFTFFATAGAIARVGAKIVFADIIDPATFNIDTKNLATLVTPKTRAIIPVDLFGQLADLEEINGSRGEAQFKGDQEDAAQANRGRNGTGSGRAHRSSRGVLSFYPTKNLGAFGDAGAICTNDDGFAETCQLLRVHGSGHQYYHKYVGGMFRLAAVQAAVLNVKLK